METIALHDIQRDPLGYLLRVERGETLLVVRDATVVAEIKPASPAAVAFRPRPFGLAAGAFTVPADFDAPLPDDVLRDFEGR